MSIAAQTVRERLDFDTQVMLVDQVRDVCRASKPVRPVARGGLPMRVLVTAAGSLGWVGDGEYRYSPTDSRGKPWPPIPTEWREIADRVAGPHAWDCAILNWYEPGASLGWHRDQSEYDRSKPIVTISLGDACSWAVRLGEDTPVSRCKLESGDVTLLAGPTRMALHTVERIIPAPLFSPIKVEDAYVPGRVSITLRVAGRPT